MQTQYQQTVGIKLTVPTMNPKGNNVLPPCNSANMYALGSTEGMTIHCKPLAKTYYEE